jgi:hypothetical protein
MIHACFHKSSSLGPRRDLAKDSHREGNVDAGTMREGIWITSSETGWAGWHDGGVAFPDGLRGQMVLRSLLS